MQSMPKCVIGSKLTKGVVAKMKSCEETFINLPCVPGVAPEDFLHLRHLLLVHHSGSKLSFHL